MTDLNYLGKFESLSEVWSQYPSGGIAGDYLHIGIVKYRWNKYELIWENARTYTESTSRERTNIDGDLTVQNDVTIAGTLRAHRVKQPNCGLFASEEALRHRYPCPEVGMWATIGDSIPGAIWRCDEQGVWHSTGETGGIDPVDLDNYYTKRDVDELHRDEIDLRSDGRIESFDSALEVALSRNDSPTIGTVIIYKTPSTESADSVIKYYVYYTDELPASDRAAWVEMSPDVYLELKKDVSISEERLELLEDKVFPLNVSLLAAEYGDNALDALGCVFERGTGSQLDGLELYFNVSRPGLGISDDDISVIRCQGVALPDSSERMYCIEKIVEDSNYRFLVEVTLHSGLKGSANGYMYFVYPCYFGSVSPTFVVNDKNVGNLLSGHGVSKHLLWDRHFSSPAFSQSVSKCCFMYPKSYGALTSISDGVDNFLSSFSVYEVSISCLDGSTQRYYVYLQKEQSTVKNYKLIFS